MIQITNCTISNNKQILINNININTQNNCIGIIGKSGSGKTLFAKMLIKLLDNNIKIKAKKLNILDFDLLSNINLLKLRSKIFYIFQDAKSILPPLIDIGRYFLIYAKTHTLLNEKEIKKQSFIIFEKLNLNNMDKIWHSYIYNLSSGEAMRVQFALALLCGANLLICDELCSNLDEKNSNNINNILKELKNNTKLIIISHDLKIIKELCDEIWLFDNGNIIEQNNTNNFFTNPKSKLGKEFIEIFKDLY